MSENGGDSPAPIQISMMYPRVQKTRGESVIFTIFCWSFTVIIWIFIILLVSIKNQGNLKQIQDFYENFKANNRKLKIIYSIILSVVYIIYLILELSSPIFKYLFNKETKIVFLEKMKEIFKKAPSLELTSNIKKSNNNNFKFKLISSRDISGNFIYSTQKKHKKFILLKLKKDIIFGDEFTSFDYYMQKEKFIKQLKEESKNCKIKEIITIMGVEKYNMFKINKSNSIMANHIFYFIFTLLTFVEIYKLYINYICIYGEFTIRKVISSLSDLSQSPEYNKYNPKINEILIDSRIYNNINNNYYNNRRNSSDYNRLGDEKKKYKNRSESTRIVNEEK